MIPQKLVLKNFLSYRQATLDFRGFHTACICGANGAGKSSLLEAITWAVWGESRAKTEDDVICLGENDVRVDFEFIYNGQTYRIIRSRQRGNTSSLEFQFKAGNGFRSLSGKGLKSTQEQIKSHLKLDYDTFTNSAYLRQGKADEFMLKGASERKKILAELLRLEHYEKLAEQAKDRSKQLKGQLDQIKYSLGNIKEKISHKKDFTQDLKQIKIEVQSIKQSEEANRQELEAINSLEQQRKTWLERFNWQNEQYNDLVKERDKLNLEKAKLSQEIADIEKIINQENDINQLQENYQKLELEKNSLDESFKLYQNKLTQKQKLEQQLASEIKTIEKKIDELNYDLRELEKKQKEIQQILENKEEVEKAVQQLSSYRQRLKELDKIKSQLYPLNQHRQNLVADIEKEKAKLHSKLDILNSESKRLAKELEPVPAKRNQVLELENIINQLDNKKNYKARLESKNSEINNQIITFQENQSNCKKQMEELQQKLILLANPEATCPLCEQPLNEHHRNYVVSKTNKQQQDLDAEIWRIGEEIAVGKRDRENLRLQLNEINTELEDYNSLVQQQIQLEAQLETIGATYLRLKEIKAEINQLEIALEQEDYAQELQRQLELTNQQIQALNYDEQTHSLITSEEKKLQRKDYEQQRINEAEKKQNELVQQKPELLEKLQQLQNQLEQLQLHSPLGQQISQLESEIKLLNYDSNRHNSLMEALKQASSVQGRYQQLQLAKQQYPQQKQRLQEIEENLGTKEINLNKMEGDLKELQNNLQQFTDNTEEIQKLENQIQQQRRQGEELIAEQGRLEQALIQIETLEKEYEESEKQLQELKKQYRIYEELGKAFGKNGIQSLMIENILPQLEAETNQILSRLTGNQLHVQFLTQRQGASKSKKQGIKMIDTLEIEISDASGTRPYETYSGGENFRINFAIRLALAKLLAQRAGTSLQMLIIDEGFGTQDGEGCERLIAAINAIADEFACILTVTHISQFKEAFHTRIEVHKTNQGSQLQIST